MEGLGNTSDRDAITTVDLPEFTENDRKTAELTTNFHHLSTATNENENLGSAIDPPEGLTFSPENEQLLLARLPEAQGSQRVINTVLDLENGQRNSGLQNAVSNRIHKMTLNLLEIAIDLFTTFDATDDIRYLDNAIEITEKVVTSNRPSEDGLLLLTAMLRARCDRTGGFEDICKAIEWMETAVIKLPPGDQAREQELYELSNALYGRYEAYGVLEDLVQAIIRAEEVLAVAPSGHHNRAAVLNNLGNQLSSRYERLGDLRDLEQAIALAEEAVAISLDPPSHAGMLNNLSIRLSWRYERLGDLRDLEQAIMRTEEAVVVIPLDHPDRTVMLGTLSEHLESRYQRLGDLQDIERAITLAEEVAAATSPDHSYRAMRLNILGTKYGFRYTRLGDLRDLEKAVMRTEEAVAATPLGHPDRAGWLGNLSAHLFYRYERLGNLRDLEQATACVEEAVVVTPLDHPDRAGLLGKLSSRLSSRYERLGDLHDLEQAITRAEEAVAGTPLNHPKRAGRLTILSNIRGSRYERLGDLRDLERAITLSAEAVAATPLGHPDHVGWSNNLSNMLASRYRRLGDLHDLEQATAHAEEAVAATPLDHPERASWLHNLSRHLYDRYELLGDLHDLEQAITCAKEAVAATPLDHPDRAGRLNGLSNKLKDRYQRLKDLHDLEQATACAEEAVAATPLDHPQRALLLNTLCVMLAIRFERSGDVQDLEQAITWAEEAIAATPLGHPNRVAMLNNLSIQLRDRYKRLGDLHDLERAITQAEEAVTEIPPRYPRRAMFLNTLINSLASMYRQTGSVQQFRYILRVSYEAWHCHIYVPSVKITIARKAGLLLASREMWQESSALLAEAVKMLPRVTSRSLGRGDQEHRLSDFTRLAVEAVSIAFKAGEEATYGLRLLEHGRGIITGLVIDCRSDLSHLKSKQPELYDKLHQLRIEIDSPLIGAETDYDGLIYQQQRRRREKAIEDLDEILSLIRESPGFEGFQLPPHSSDLMAMANEGPIVIFNSTRYRSDSIIVTSSTVKTLVLPKLLYSSVEERMSNIAKLARGGRATYQSRNKRMEEILLWLWDVAVEPVFTALQYTAVDPSNLPRVWWMGMGLLAMAPFHAAGDHSPRSTRNTMSRAISSYIPTIKSLSYARQKPLELLNKPNPHILLVAMPTTPTDKLSNPTPEPLNPLKNATREVETIVNLVKGKAIPTQLDCPSTAQVIAKLPSHHMIHFACHGISDGRNPSNSHLVLRKDDGSESGTADKLTVGDISNMNIKQAQIAYISACSTAENASESLVDESIYIASGFQLAGFSHVLATQWVSNDKACMRVAGDFYSLLFRSQPSGLSEEGHRRVSAAFHYAVKKLRDANLRQPILWAPYIHTGA